MVFGPDLIIKFFKLDKGYDTEIIDLKSYRMGEILNLAFILLGGKLIIDNLPNMISNLLFSFKSMASLNVYPHIDSQSNVKIVVNILFLLVGYFMIAKREYLVKILTSKKQDVE